MIGPNSITLDTEPVRLTLVAKFNDSLPKDKIVGTYIDSDFQRQRIDFRKNRLHSIAEDVCRIIGDSAPFVDRVTLHMNRFNPVANHFRG